MSIKPEKSSEDEDFENKLQDKCIPDIEAYRLRKERDAYLKQVQELSQEIKRLNAIILTLTSKSKT